ncbi:MAG: zinc-dependent peptidase [Flavihumibacter sp.]
MFGLFFFLALLAGIYFWRQQNRAEEEKRPIPANTGQILQAEVRYYRELAPAEQQRFVQEVTGFLKATRIDPVNTSITDTDKVLVAASAVIPIFGFKEWHYTNLTDVLIYDDRFNENFQSTGDNRNLMGMVGSGYMNGKMLLSKTALREGFSNKTDKENTGIHEFVHLLDKADGAADGLPEALLSRQFTIPWLDMIHRQIQDIRANKSDINPYGATNQAEFFAVASEYFFERPELLRQKHPELYEMLEKVFKQDPAG